MTIEIPDDLYHRAEREATRRGLTVGEYVHLTLDRALEQVGKYRLTAPLFTSKDPGALCLTNEDIRRLEEEDDLRRLGLL